MKQNYLLVFAISLIISGCETINPSEDIPGYIQVDKVSIVNEPNALKITDIWVYVDNNLQGIYELPAQFPILETGQHTFEIYAGIKVNGVAKTRAIYPFYFSYEQDLVLNELDLIKLSPVVDYDPNIQIRWQEDFEDIGLSLDTVNYSDTTLLFTDDDVYAGNYSGKISLAKDHERVGVITTNAFNFSDQIGRPVFMELNYKNNTEIGIGYITNTNGVFDEELIIILNKSEDWNKIYINLGESIDKYAEGTLFKYYFSVNKFDSTTTATVLLDNIKIIHFQ